MITAKMAARVQSEWALVHPTSVPHNIQQTRLDRTQLSDGDSQHSDGYQIRFLDKPGATALNSQSNTNEMVNINRTTLQAIDTKISARLIIYTNLTIFNNVL